jgi:hypothetical protein
LINGLIWGSIKLKDLRFSWVHSHELQNYKCPYACLPVATCGHVNAIQSTGLKLKNLRKFWIMPSKQRGRLFTCSPNLSLVRKKTCQKRAETAILRPQYGFQEFRMSELCWEAFTQPRILIFGWDCGRTLKFYLVLSLLFWSLLRNHDHYPSHYMGIYYGNLSKWETDKHKLKFLPQGME